MYEPRLYWLIPCLLWLQSSCGGVCAKNLFLVCAKNLPKGAEANLLCVLTMFPVPEKEKKLMNTLHAWGLSDIIRVMINSVNMNFVSFSLTLLLSYLLTYFRTRTVSLDINNKFSLSLFSYASFHVTEII